MKAFVSSQVSALIDGVDGLEALPLVPYDKLDTPVSSHADMLIFVLESVIFCYEDYYLSNRSIFDEAEQCGYEIIQVKSKCSKRYPNDISLNVLKIGEVLVANLKHTASEILLFAKEKGYKLVDVKQGYSACATLVLDERNAITADVSIYNALKSINKNVLLIDPDGIELQGYNCGFIGGASFVVGKTVYFLGDICIHPSYDKIHDKIISLGMEEKSISSRHVYDFGGIRSI